MATTADFRNGLCIEFKNAIYTIVSFQHVKPGKGSAFVRTKLKGIVNKKVIDNTFSAGAKIVPIRIEKRPCQFLYRDNDYYYFMDNHSFENFSLSKSNIVDGDFLKSGLNVNILVRDDTNQVLACEMPPSFSLQVAHTEQAVRGNTANKATKLATLETGATIQVPLFINTGDQIVVSATKHEYISREKSHPKP